MTSNKEKLLRDLGNALIHASLADHQHSIGRQDGPERDRKLVAGFMTAIDQTCGLSGVYDYPQFMLELAKQVAAKVGCSVVEGDGS